MQLWQFHKILSDAVGDATRSDPISITDGVRFSREERNSYLYRAMIEVINKRLLALKIKTPTEADKYIYSYFPTSLRQQSFEFYNDDELRVRVNVNNVRFAYIYTAKLLVDARYDHPLFNDNTPPPGYIPNRLIVPIIVRTHTNMNIKHNDMIRNEAYISLEYANNDTTIIQEPWLYVQQNKRFINKTADLIELTFIETPPDLSTLTPSSFVKVDEMHINEIIAQAINFMLIDHQDIEITPQFVQENSNINNIMLQLMQDPNETINQ